MTKPTINRRDALCSLATVGVAATAITSFETSSASAKEIGIAKLPANIKDAADRVIKGTKWSKAHKAKGVFELDGIDGMEHDVSVLVTTDGKVTGVERKIAVKEVPAKVLKAATDKIAKFEVEVALEVYHGADMKSLDDAELVYELEGSAGKGNQATINVTPKGEVSEVKTEITLKEVPKVVMNALSSKEPEFTATIVHKLEEGGAVVGYLFAHDFKKHKKESVVFVSADGKEVESSHDGE